MAFATRKLDGETSSRRKRRSSRRQVRWAASWIAVPPVRISCDGGRLRPTKPMPWSRRGGSPALPLSELAERRETRRHSRTGGRRFVLVARPWWSSAACSWSVRPNSAASASGEQPRHCLAGLVGSAQFYGCRIIGRARLAEAFVDFAAGEMRPGLHGAWGMRGWPVVGWAERGGGVRPWSRQSRCRASHLTWGLAGRCRGVRATRPRTCRRGAGYPRLSSAIRQAG